MTTAVPTPTAHPCPKCGRAPSLDFCGLGWSAACSDCFDGAPDAGPQLVASGLTRAEVIANWNERVEEETPCEECGAIVETKKVQIGASMFDLCEGCRAKFDANDRKDDGPDYIADEEAPTAATK